jgi:ParB family chromosome partitioning protein
MSSLTDKAKSIRLDNLDDVRLPSPSSSQTPSSTSPAATPGPRTGVGAFTASLAMGHQLEADNERLKLQLDKFEDAVVVEFLDPKLVRVSRYANRHELSFSGSEFQKLRDDIESAGRNVQAIKVRPLQIEDGLQTYEIVFGHRRHRACLELGLPVAAIVEDLTDAELFAEMDRENRARADLSPWEQGVMYKQALDAGLFRSQRHLAESIGVPQSAVSRSVTLADLPEFVLSAFANPLELQFRWAAAMQERLKSDPEAVKLVAAELTALLPQLPAKEVFRRLTGVALTTLPAPLQLTSGGRNVGSFGVSKSGDLEIYVNKGVLDASAQKKLSDFLLKLLG